MALSEALDIALSSKTQELFAKESKVLLKAHIDAPSMRENMAALHREFLEEDAHQEDLKRQTRASTIRKDSLKRRLHVLVSGSLDIAIAGVGKDSPEAKNFRMIRSRIAEIAANPQTTQEPTPEATA